MGWGWGGRCSSGDGEAGGHEMPSAAFPYGSSLTALIPHSEMAPFGTGSIGLFGV